MHRLVSIVLLIGVAIAAVAIDLALRILRPRKGGDGDTSV